MELDKVVKYIAMQAGFTDINFIVDVRLVDEGSGAYISEWNLDMDQPTEADLIAAEPLMLAYEESIAYRALRSAAYPSYGDQLDMIYWDKKNTTTTWVDAIEAVKTEYPKPA